MSKKRVKERARERASRVEIAALLSSLALLHSCCTLRSPLLSVTLTLLLSPVRLDYALCVHARTRTISLARSHPAIAFLFVCHRRSCCRRLCFILFSLPLRLLLLLLLLLLFLLPFLLLCCAFTRGSSWVCIENYATFTNGTLQKVEVNLPRSNESDPSRAEFVVDNVVIVVVSCSVSIHVICLSLLSAAFVKIR